MIRYFDVKERNLKFIRSDITPLPLGGDGEESAVFHGGFHLLKRLLVAKRRYKAEKRY